MIEDVIEFHVEIKKRFSNSWKCGNNIENINGKLFIVKKEVAEKICKIRGNSKKTRK